VQKISKNHEQKLKKYLWIKNTPWKNEQKLWEVTRKYTQLFSKVPGIQCICVCNSLAMNACHKDSDIDLFIITKKNRLWTARIAITLILFLLWKRKTSKKHAGQFCLSFFISEEEPSLKNIALKDDIYLLYWLETLTPIVNKNHAFEKFIEENQKWCGIHNIHIDQKNSTPFSQETHKFWTSFWDYCEKLLKSIFLPRTEKNFQKLWKPSWVVISDTMLKFHDQDKRKEIRNTIFSQREKWNYK